LLESQVKLRPQKRRLEAAITRHRVTAQRMVGCPGDMPIRSDKPGYPMNRQFSDVPQDRPVIAAERLGFENEVCAFSVCSYLSPSDTTSGGSAAWPAVVYRGNSLFRPNLSDCQYSAGGGSI
jgi:hypothetical protein